MASGRQVISSIFLKKSSGSQAWGKFIVLLLLSLALIFLDYHSSYFSKPRSWLSTIVTPLQWITDTPSRVRNFVSENLTSRKALVEENEKLKFDNLFLKQKLQQFSSLSVQNKRLRALLNSSKKMKGKVRIAEVIGVDSDPQIRQITINKGSGDGAFVGQPVLGASGIMGQIVSTNYFASRVLLITDSSSRIPVEVNRTGYRAIAAGNNFSHALSLLYLPDTTDIKQGDLLVSSGLGGRFPSGYPVAKVISVEHLPGHKFASIQATPMADMDKSRLVLILFPESNAEAKEAMIPDTPVSVSRKKGGK